MEHETLYTASKWDILKYLERGPSSPLELSRACKTSIANVSQQLRLLEMAGLVKGERISNRDKGKPRMLYSLAGDLSYLIATTGDFVEKKSLHLSEYNKIVMRIWFYPKHEFRYALEKAFWKIEEHLDKITFIALDTAKDTPLIFFIQGKATLHPFTITDPLGVVRQIIFTNQLPKSFTTTYILYDPQGIALEKNRKRSGDKNG